MAETTPDPNPAFKKASQPDSGTAPDAAPASDTMALIIDIQGAGGNNPADMKAYLHKLGQTIEDLRARNIPVTWVTMADKNHLYPPTTSGPGAQVRDMSQLAKMGFDGVNPGQQGRMIFQQFLKQHGPRTNEAVYTKFYKGAFVEPEDYTDKPGLRRHIQNDYRKNKDGTPIKLPEAGAYDDGPTLAEYAHGRGVKNLLVMGAVSTNCDTETALSGNAKGFHSQIAVDRVLSWEGDETKVDPRTSKLLWHGGDAAAAPDAYHRGKISTRLEKIAAKEKDERGISDADVEAVRDGLTTTDEFLAAHPLPAATAASTVQTARSQPALSAPFPA